MSVHITVTDRGTDIKIFLSEERMEKLYQKWLKKTLGKRGEPNKLDKIVTELPGEARGPTQDVQGPPPLEPSVGGY